MPKKSHNQYYYIQIAAAVLFIAAVLGSMLYKKMNTSNEEVHFHAGFHIYSDNRLLDFSDIRYMHLNPCAEDDTKHIDSAEERAHLHNNIGDVVHAHSSRATWGDLLTNLRFASNGYKTYYLNGKLAPNLESTPIRAYDQMLLLVGENDNIQEKIDSLPDENLIRQAEQLTEGC